ncbi:hypothetical protein [Nocardia rhizosphaerae]|uniref:Uncharacterized protein n=1 Tax=Nocardia rhizosphaerae TaxID=1691571 RepID=A0ABV8L048_9NOCA
MTRPEHAASEVLIPTVLSANGANPVDRRGLARLALAADLPDLCLQHGLAAETEYEAAITFCGTEEYQSGSVFGRSTVRRLGRRRFLPGMGGPEPEADAILDVRMRMCRRCKRRVDVIQFLCLATVFAGVVAVVGALATVQQGATELTRYFAYAIFPGWIPGGLLLAAFLFSRARPQWRARRTPDRRYIAVHAHPRFHAAFDAA